MFLKPNLLKEIHPYILKLIKLITDILINKLVS